MPAPRKSRRRPVEPLDWEELEKAPSLNGMLSFLTLSPEELQRSYSERQERLRPVPMGELPIGDSPQPPAPGPAAPRRVPSKLNKTQENAVLPRALAEEAGAAEPRGESPIGDSWPGRLIGRRQKIYRAGRAQDGHSAGEQLLYQALWREAQRETDESKLITIGYGRMQELCKLDRSNCKKNMQSLIAKLAVEVVAEYSTRQLQGYTYRIYDYGPILRRRKAAGMEYVIRTSGVRFVRIPMGDLPVCDSLSPEESPIGESPIGPMGESPIAPMGDLPLSIIIEKERKEEEQRKEVLSSSSLVELTSEIRKLVESFDDDAVRTLWARCREKAPDCTPEEIVYCVRLKVRQWLHSTAVSNPVGLLLTAVPKCLEGPAALHLAFRRRRQLQSSACEADHREYQRLLSEQQAALLDPEASEEDKAFARLILGKP